MELCPLALGVETCEHIHDDYMEPICICNLFISNASLIPSLSSQVTTQSRAPAAIQATKSQGGSGKIPEPRESHEVPEPPVTLSTGCRTDTESLWGHGAETHTAVSSPDLIRDSVSAEEGMAVSLGERRDRSRCHLAWDSQAWSPTLTRAAAAGCYSHPSL